MMHRYRSCSSLVHLPGLALAGLLLSPDPAAKGAEAASSADLGLFEGHGDIGTVGRAGSATWDPVSQAYRVAGGGENMWSDRDAFHFVWKRIAGDLTVTARITWPEAGGHAHRKAVLLIRQGLEPDAPYVDAARHGDGLTSLQFRETPGGPTREIQASLTAPDVLRLERHGDFFSLSLAQGTAPLRTGAGGVRLALRDPVYVGLGVCAHDNQRLESAVFSQVELTRHASRPLTNASMESTLEVVTIASKDRRAVYPTTEHLEAPNWSPDGTFLLFNSRGRIYRFPLPAGPPELIDTGFAQRCNNDHGISPDGIHLALSDQTETGASLIYVVPIKGGSPRRVTARGPSYWHGWSPDGRILAYCAERDGEFDVYTIPATGGAERRLTTAQGLDDGPDYTADGRFIYFNSERTGLMKIWRMQPDGSQPEQVTFDDYNDWFPHPSPDGKWVVFLSYAKEVKGHPANQDVLLRLMPLGGGEIQVLARLFGGQGTINVPSWSPDSRQVAFVSYRPVWR